MGIQTYDNIQAGMPFLEAIYHENIDWIPATASTTAGGISGGLAPLIPAGTSFGGVLAYGGLDGFISGVLDQGILNQLSPCQDWNEDLLETGISSGIAGAATAGLFDAGGRALSGLVRSHNTGVSAPGLTDWARRAVNVREKYNVSRRRNVGIAQWNLRDNQGPINLGELPAISGRKSPEGTAPVPESRLYEWIEDKFPREFDTELKLLEYIGQIFTNNPAGVYPNVRGKVTLFTERKPCLSCRGVIAQFKEMFPFVEVELIHGATPSARR